MPVRKGTARLNVRLRCSSASAGGQCVEVGLSAPYIILLEFWDPVTPLRALEKALLTPMPPAAGQHYAGPRLSPRAGGAPTALEAGAGAAGQVMTLKPPGFGHRPTLKPPRPQSTALLTSGRMYRMVPQLLGPMPAALLA